MRRLVDYVFMEAADESKREGGATVKINDVMKKWRVSIG